MGTQWVHGLGIERVLYTTIQWNKLLYHLPYCTYVPSMRNRKSPMAAANTYPTALM